jgi:hypothetical protein
VLRLIREVLGFRPRGKGTDVAGALDFLGRVTHRHAVVFLVSDFFAAGFERRLRIIARRHDTIALAIADPRERTLPPVGLVELEDAETGETVTLDTSSRAVRSRWEALAREREASLVRLLRSANVDHLPVASGEDYVRDLVRFFRARERRR